MHSDLSTYRRLIGYMRGKVWYFALAIVGYLLAAASEVVFAQTLGAVVDTFQTDGGIADSATSSTNWIPGFMELVGWGMTIMFPLLIVGTAIFRAIGTVAGEALLSRVSLNVIHRVRTELFERLLVLPSSYYDSSRQGEISNRLTDTAAKLRDTVTDVLKIGIQDGGKLVVFLYALIALNAALTGIFLLLAPVVAVVVRVASRRFRRISQRIQSSMGDVTQVGQETANAYKLIRANGGQHRERERFQAASTTNLNQNLKMVATKAASTQFIQMMVALAIGLLVGVLFIPEVSGTMTTGDLVQYITIAGLLASPIKRLSDLNSRIQTGLAAADDIFAQMDHEAERDDGGVELGSAVGDIEFRGISFSYQSSDDLVLDDFSLHVKPGETVAIVGTTGSGKSTITELLMGFYEPISGEILIDGVPLESISKQSLRRLVAWVSQDVFLFNDTLKANIAYGELADASAEAIDSVVAKSRVIEFVNRLPQGIDSVVGERGLNLSQGQRQRIAIARALLKDAPILVLDEATSSLDTDTESVLQEVLSAEMVDRTMIVIAHRLSTVENADRIVVLEKGRIIESGTHGELLNAGGRYALLYRSAEQQERSEPPTGSEAEAIARRVAKPISSRWYERIWYGESDWALALRPLSWIFSWVVRVRRRRAMTSSSKTSRSRVPVIVVGNIAIGGTGKTPLVLFLAEWLKRRGKRVGVVLRGYGGKSKIVRGVGAGDPVSQVGDEAPLIAGRTACPVYTGIDREAAVKELSLAHDVDCIISDDGLQHYAMGRDVEIAVVDGERGLGNGLTLPAGPLREPPSRLADVDCVVVNGGSTLRFGAVEAIGMQLRPKRLVHIHTKESIDTAGAVSRLGTRVVAVSGIGNPKRFLDTLNDLGFDPIDRSFPDHADFRRRDFAGIEPDATIVVTEKDWRKVAELDLPHTDIWYIEVDAEFEAGADEVFTEIFERHGIAL